MESAPAGGSRVEASLATIRLADGPERLSADVGFLFTEWPLADRFAAAARAGFRAVEHPNPFAIPAPDLARTLSDHGLTFVQTSFPAGDPARGEKGFAALPDRASAFRESVDPTLDYAEAVGCRLVHAMAGVRPAGVAQDVLWETYLDSIAYAADAAARRGISILIEPVGPGSIADYVIDRPALAVSGIRTLGRPNVKLLMDVFHCVSLAQDPVSLIREHAALIAHVQIADHPGRHEPGLGTIAFGPVFEAPDAVSYRGFIGCEYHPTARTEDSFGWRKAAGSTSHLNREAT